MVLDKFGYLMFLLEELSCLVCLEDAKPKFFPKINPDVSVSPSNMLLVSCLEFPLIWINFLLMFFAFSYDLVMRLCAFMDLSLIHI